MERIVYTDTELIVQNLVWYPPVVETDEVDLTLLSLHLFIQKPRITTVTS